MVDGIPDWLLRAFRLVLIPDYHHPWLSFLLSVSPTTHLYCMYSWRSAMLIHNEPVARYVKLWVAHAPEIPGTFSTPPQVSDPDMHHGTCVTHVPWCMPGSLTRGFLWSWWRENIPGIPGACATRNFTYVVRGPWSQSSWVQSNLGVNFWHTN